MNLQGFPQNVHGFWRYVDEGGRNHEPCVDLFRERVDMGKHKLCSRIIPSRGVFVRWRDLPMGLANANILPSVECEPSSFAFPWRMLPSLSAIGSSAISVMEEVAVESSHLCVLNTVGRVYLCAKRPKVF
jgi:hypothetical protein